MINPLFDFLDLPERTEKPRETGITHVIDRGMCESEIQNMLNAAHRSVDILKTGWGTSVVMYPAITRKIRQCKDHHIAFCLGGTLFEVCYSQGRVKQLMRVVQDLGLECIEISSGAVDVPMMYKLNMVKAYSGKFKVLAEVGNKDADAIVAPYLWLREVEDLLNAGAWKVILEARESGTAGLARPSGEIRTGLIDEITQTMDPQHLIFEAPLKAQQVWFIKRFGPNVNLGNIAPGDVVALETLRLGLRGDTLMHFHGGGE